MARSLTFRQRLFCEFFLGESGGNAVDTARRAGYGSPERVAQDVAKRGVQAAIARGSPAPP